MPLRQAIIETLKDGEDTWKSVMSLIAGISWAVVAQLTNLQGKDAMIATSAGALMGWAYGKDIWNYIFHQKTQQ